MAKEEKNRFEIKEVATETGLIVFDNERNLELTEAMYRTEVLNLLDKIAKEMLPK